MLVIKGVGSGRQILNMAGACRRTVRRGATSGHILSQLRAKARTAANPLDYKKVITERSFAKDWKPQNPLGPHQRMRNVVAYANR
eukprot:SAG22_NODE_131_length_18561_cov_10.941387_12_plen_85_part_00